MLPGFPTLHPDSSQGIPRPPLLHNPISTSYRANPVSRTTIQSIVFSDFSLKMFTLKHSHCYAGHCNHSARDLLPEPPESSSPTCGATAPCAALPTRTLSSITTQPRKPGNGHEGVSHWLLGSHWNSAKCPERVLDDHRLQFRITESVQVVQLLRLLHFPQPLLDFPDLDSFEDYRLLALAG